MWDGVVRFYDVKVIFLRATYKYRYADIKDIDDALSDDEFEVINISECDNFEDELRTKIVHQLEHNQKQETLSKEFKDVEQETIKRLVDDFVSKGGSQEEATHLAKFTQLEDMI